MSSPLERPDEIFLADELLISWDAPAKGLWGPGTLFGGRVVVVSVSDRGKILKAAYVDSDRPPALLEFEDWMLIKAKLYGEGFVHHALELKDEEWFASVPESYTDIAIEGEEIVQTKKMKTVAPTIKRVSE